MGRVWDCRSAAPSLNRMAAACGLPTILRAVRAFASPCPPTSRGPEPLSPILAAKEVRPDDLAAANSPHHPAPRACPPDEPCLRIAVWPPRGGGGAMA